MQAHDLCRLITKVKLDHRPAWLQTSMQPVGRWVVGGQVGEGGEVEVARQKLEQVERVGLGGRMVRGASLPTTMSLQS